MGFVGVCGDGGWVWGFSGFCYIAGLSCMAACLVFSLLELLGIFSSVIFKEHS